MSDESVERLNSLREVTEAASYGEVVRRALQYYEEITEKLEVVIEQSTEPQRLTARIQVVLPSRTSARLERMCANADLSYSEVIRRALAIYGRFVETRARERSSQSPLSRQQNLIRERLLVRSPTL